MHITDYTVIVEWEVFEVWHKLNSSTLLFLDALHTEDGTIGGGRFLCRTLWLGFLGD